MKWSAIALALALVSTNALADIRISWTPPAATPGAEVSEYLFWCIWQFQDDGVTPRVYGAPNRLPATQTEYLREWYDAKPWKCKIQSYSAEGMNGTGAASVDSNEIFFVVENNEIYVPPGAVPLPPGNLTVETIIP